jgi:sulfur transfer protein SufE
MGNPTSELLKIHNAFASVDDDKLLFRQLLFTATQLMPMDPARVKPENKVPECISTVYIDATAIVKHDGRIHIHFVGENHALLSKCMVAFLVRGLSGTL